MPLLKGKKNQGKNITELVNKFEETGKIGKAKPKGKGKAIKMAVAISYNVLKPKYKGKGKTNIGKKG